MSPLAPSSIRNLMIAVAIAALFSSGCCVTTCGVSPCGLGAGGIACGTACDGACGMEPCGTTMMVPDCGAPADCSCDSCSVPEPSCGAPVASGVACGGNCGTAGCGGIARRPLGCLGLGCVGKIFSIASYGCSTPVYGNNGCGEAYYHDWISEPPCADPCDGCGNWTGTACGDCAGTTIVDPTCGAPIEPACGVPVEPACGVESVIESCDSGCGGCNSCAMGHRNAFQVPGRALYSTWTGVGGFLRGVRGGLFPSCRTCNAFSFSQSCVNCNTGGWATETVVDPGHGCASCTATATQQPSVRQMVGRQATNHMAKNVVGAGVGRIPHEVVTKTIKTAHGRPPHKVLSNRLR